MVENVTVHVPPDDYRVDPERWEFWHGTKGWLHLVRRSLGDEKCFSIVLSAVASEMRKRMGVQAAKEVFQGFADTMEEAAKGDLPDE